MPYSRLIRKPTRRPRERHDAHWGMALWAEKGGPGAKVVVLNQDVQYHLNEGQKLLGVAMQKAIVPDTADALV